MTDEDAPAPARSTPARIAGWFGIALGALILLVAGLVLFLNTGPGRGLVARQLSAFETESGLNIRVQAIRGSLYGRMTLSGVEVRDPKGVFLSAPELTLDWRPFAYLSNKVDVRALIVPEARLARLPELRPTESDPDAPLLPDLDIAIGRLEVGRLAIDPPVTGRRHLVRVTGSADIADGRARLTADAAALTGPGIAGGDRLRLVLDAVPDANRLQLDARLTAPAGGVIDSFAGLDQPIALTLGGSGDWKRWRGKLAATLGGASLADLALTGNDGRFAARGTTHPGLILGDGPAARLVEPALDVDLAAALGARKADTRLTLRSSALAIEGGGLIDLGTNRLGGVKITARLLTPGSIAPNLNGRDVQLAANLDGPMATPTVDYHLSAATIGFGEIAVQGLSATGRATIDADRILIPVAARAQRVTGLNAAAGGLLTNLAVDGDLAWSGGRILSDNLKLRSDRIDATAIVVADLGEGRYTGALKGRVNDYQVDGLGRINLVTDAELVTGPKGGFGITGVVRVATRHLDNATLRDTLGGNAVMTARVGFDEDGVATLRDLRMSAPDFRITGGSGSYRPDGRIRFDATATSTRYGPLAVTATGTLERPVVRLRAPSPNVGIQLSDVEAELVGTAAGYEVTARGGSPYGPFNADLLIRSGTGPLGVDIRHARFAGIDIKGNLVQTSSGPFAGTLGLDGSGLNGTVVLAAAGAVQRADVDVRADNARIPGDTPITIGSGTVRATVLLPDAGPSVTADVRLADVRQGEISLANARSRVRYQDGRGTVALTADGQSGVPFRLAAQAVLAPDRIVANLKGDVNGIAIRLERPATVRRAADDWMLDPVTLVVPQGRMQVSGQYGSVTRIDARLDNLDVGIVEAFTPGLGLGGKASGTIAATLPAGNALPQAEARLAISGFTRTAAATVSTPVDIATRARLDGNGADVAAIIRRGSTIIGRLQARMTPTTEAGGWSERLMTASLTGGIRYNGPAEVPWTLTGIAGQTLRGPIALAADFGGRVDRPTLSGIARSSGLAYTNQAFGTRIDDIRLDGRFTETRLDITSLTGRAGEGTVTGSGFIGFDAAGGFPMSLSARLTRAQLADSDDLGATVSGTLAITNGREAGMKIAGDLNIPEARYVIVRQGAAEVPTLTGIRRKGAPPPKPDSAVTRPMAIALDIRIRADNRLFVSGMGLEAEWATDLRVTGTAAAPRVIGRLDVVRGTYSFAGRRLDLDERSQIRFEGGDMMDPSLGISASTTVEGITAIINIGGRAQAPEISFTSTPALPQDEVLARLLFGQSLTSLTPTQAIQLAAALNSLRGGGGGLNPLGKLRSATGIDRLRVLGADQATGRGTALSAGQYISNDIYVEVITDAKGFTATQLEIALSKTLSILSQTGSFGGSNVNLRYSKDY